MNSTLFKLLQDLASGSQKHATERCHAVHWGPPMKCLLVFPLADQSCTSCVNCCLGVKTLGMGVQTLMERAVVLGMGAQQQTASPALAELLSQYAGILASQVPLPLTTRSVSYLCCVTVSVTFTPSTLSPPAVPHRPK